MQPFYENIQYLKAYFISLSVFIFTKLLGFFEQINVIKLVEFIASVSNLFFIVFLGIAKIRHETKKKANEKGNIQP